MERTWLRLAFASRYGHQPLSELMQLDYDDLNTYCKSLAELMRDENESHSMNSMYTGG